jgi:hypothetical protein
MTFSSPIFGFQNGGGREGVVCAVDRIELAVSLRPKPRECLFSMEYDFMRL